MKDNNLDSTKKVCCQNKWKVLRETPVGVYFLNNSCEESRHRIRKIDEKISLLKLERIGEICQNAPRQIIVCDLCQKSFYNLEK